MPRGVLYVVIIVLVGVAGYFAYDAYQRDRNTLEIQIGPDGLKIDPPAR